MDDEHGLNPAPGGTARLGGNLLPDLSYHTFPDGNDVAYQSVAWSTGSHRMVKVECCARGNNIRYCKAKGVVRGALVWIVGSVREKTGNDGVAESIINVQDMTSETCASWVEDPL